MKAIVGLLSGAVLGAVLVPCFIGIATLAVAGGYLVADAIDPIQWPERLEVASMKQFLGVAAYVGAMVGGVFGMIFGAQS